LQVFDIERKLTYKNLGKWYQELREYRPDIPCICVANKIDGEYYEQMFEHVGECMG
jgi:Rab-like protein 2